ncbi:glycosyltransferase family 2 protein [Phocaeicola sartorii]|uniref:glycosyltransferase family 2 protein n=1 Tax=Phocaeicola sartorii TaxID=671267 RepID=UPI001F578FA1|nr:glycosyltransferase family 2 protein [Phocaeicola sartorii]
MEKPIVTIIVPVYKAEKYLSCCIDSILAQSFKDFELLLIDDGSPDSSGQICNEYASKDNRIHSFHKENGGVSSARNMGIDNAQGEWICFIDSDDWVEADFLKELIQYDSFDLIVGGLDSFGCTAISTKRNRNLVVDLKHSHQEAQILNADIGNTISAFYYSCGKLFRRSIISQNRLRFDTRMKMCEDTCFLMQYLTHADKIILSDSSSYRYRVLFIVDKYAVDYECYKIHINLFDKYLSELECSLNNKMTILKKKIYTAF